MKKRYVLSLLVVLVFVISLQAQWTQVTTTNNIINAMETYNGQLYLGGNFTNINGNSSYFSATYNGSTFGNHTNLLGGTGFQDLTEHDGSLFGGGGLTQTGGGPLGVGIWNGGTWGGGYNVGNPINVNALISFNGDLIVGGAFETPGPRIARHNGTSYMPMGGGFDATVTDLEIFNSELYATGAMQNSGSTPVSRIAKWNGTEWVPLGTGLSGSGSALAVWNGALYVCGNFTTAGGVTVNNIAKWDGTSWSALGSGIPTGAGQGVFEMLATPGGLLVGGRFPNAGGVPTGNLALWTGNNWLSAGDFPLETGVNTMHIFQGQIYLSTYGIIGGVPTGRLFRSGSVGMDELAFAADIVAFPNPTGQMLYLQGDLSEIKGIEIFDASGRQVAAPRLLNSFDLSALTPGVYHLQLVGDSGRRTLCMVKE